MEYNLQLQIFYGLLASSLIGFLYSREQYAVLNKEMQKNVSNLLSKIEELERKTQEGSYRINCLENKVADSSDRISSIEDRLLDI